MTIPDLEARFKALLTRRLGIPAEQIAPTARLVEDLEADSLDFVELAIAAEREFDIEISEDQLKQIETVADAIALIQELVNSRSN